MSRAVATVVGAALVSALVPVAAHADASSILSAINAQRASFDVAPVTARSDWNTACANHDVYMTRARTLTHTEDSASSLFTTTGLWAAQHSILASDSQGFAAGGNPWANSPIHEFQALHPWLRSTGVDVTGQYACMITLAGQDGGYTADPHLVTYPGVGQSVPAAETANESPFVPGDDVGLPQGTTTGPHLYVYALGPDHFTQVEVRSASLTDADGNDVAVRWVDHSSAQSGPYLNGGAIVIPVRPLTAGVAYTLRVEVAATTDAGSTTVMSRTAGFYAGTPSVASNDSGDAAQAASGTPISTAPQPKPTTSLDNGNGTVKVSLAWHGKGIRARIHCASATDRCEGPLRILVNRKGRSAQKLRFVARSGPLKVSLSPGRTISRRITMTRKQRHSGHVHGFSIRFGGPSPVVAKAFSVE